MSQLAQSAAPARPGDGRAEARSGRARLRLRFDDSSTPAGFIDGSVVLAYMAGADLGTGSTASLLAWYAVTLFCKLLLLLAFWSKRNKLTGSALGFLGACTLMVSATLFAGVDTPGPYLAAVGFVSHLTLSLVLIGRTTFRRYLTAALATSVAGAGIHIALCLTHHMTEVWGRFLYFGDNHPNLGGEIEASAAIAAALALPRRYALPAIAILLVDMALLQARSAMLAGAAVVAVTFFIDPNNRLTPRRVLALFVTGAVLLGALIASGAGGAIANSVSNLLLLNDQYRGITSGASGRSDVWAASIDLFTESPIYGHSLGYFDNIGFIGSHNLILYGLAQFGVMAVGFFCAIIIAYARLYKRHPYGFWIVLMALPLFLFNDRLISLNPYPFLVYVMLLANVAPGEYSQSPGQPKSGTAPERAARQGMPQANAGAWRPVRAASGKTRSATPRSRA